jgi:hypothetical protein
MTYTKMRWDAPVPKYKGIKIEMIEYFNARGMKRVYGRSDYYGRHHDFNMAIWATSKGRLFMRLWSRSYYIDDISFEIIGIDVAKSIIHPHMENCDDWLPYKVREAYDTWIKDEL